MATRKGEVVETTVEYGLVERRTGRRIWLNVSEGYAEGEVHSFAEPGQGQREYAVDAPEMVTAALVEDRPLMNSSGERPAWGPYRPDDLEMVRVETTRVSTPMAFPVLSPPRLRTVEAMDLTRSQVARIDPDLAALLPRGSYRMQVVHRVVASPELDDLPDTVVDFDAWGLSRLRVVAVLPVPEDRSGHLPEGAEAAMVLCMPDERASPIPPYVTWQRAGGLTP